MFFTRSVLKKFFSEGQKRVMKVEQKRLHYCRDKEKDLYKTVNCSVTVQR